MPSGRSLQIRNGVSVGVDAPVGTIHDVVTTLRAASAASDEAVATEKAVSTALAAAVAPVTSVTWSAVTSKPAHVTEIAAIAGSNDDFVQQKSGVLTNRTVAQVKADLALVVGPSAATDGCLPLYDGTTGKLVKNSAYTPSSFLAAADLTVTKQGNTFNGSSQLVQTTADGKYPAMDGSLITGVVAGTGNVVGPSVAVNSDIALFDGTTGKLIKDAGYALTYFQPAGDPTLTKQGNTFNGNSQLVRTTAIGKLPALDGSLLTNLPAGAGDVTGPSGATSGKFAVFDGTTGKILANSVYGASSFQAALSNAAGADEPLLSGSTLAGLTAGENITLTEASGVITIAATGGGGGGGSGEWELMERWSVTAETGVQTSHKFTGLDGDADRRYKLVLKLIPANSVTGQINLNFNDDVTSGHYYYKYWDSGAPSGGNSGATTAGQLAYCDSASSVMLVTLCEIFAETGAIRPAVMIGNQYTTTSILTTSRNTSFWTDTANNMTSATVSFGTDGIGIGSYIELWRLGDGTGGGGTTWNVITDSTSAVVSNGYFIDSTSNVVTLTLPATPTIGQQVSVRVLDMTNTITIDGNGENIEGSASDLVLDVPMTGAVFVYSNAAYGWVIVNN